MDSMDRFLSVTPQILVGAGISGESISMEIREREEGIAIGIINKASRGYDLVRWGRNRLSKMGKFLLGNVAKKLLEKLRTEWPSIIPKPETPYGYPTFPLQLTADCFRPKFLFEG